MKFEIPGVSSKKFILSYAAGALLLWLFFRRTDWASAILGVRSVAWPLLAIAIALRFAALIASALRWKYLLLPVQRVGFASTLAAVMAGMTVTLAISGQAAEIARPLILSRNENLDFTAALSTVTVEWLLDALGVLTVFIPALIVLRSIGRGGTGEFYAASNITIAVLLLLFAAAMATLWLIRKHSVRFTCHRLPIPEKFRSLLAHQLQRFDTGLKSLRRPHGFSSLYGYSLSISLLTALSCWVALAAFGLSLPFVAAFVVLGMITVGGMIPTPGAIGGFHAVCQLSLMILFRVESARTVLPVAGMHAVLYIPAAIIGALCSFPYLRSEQQEISP